MAEREKGFTLVEVIVVMAIISLLVGIMVPIVFRVWEGQEIEATEKKLTYIKEAMIGNPSLMSNGTRNSFGFTGDLGQLPPDLDALISYANENGTFGPYLGGGVSTQSFKKDSWGYDLTYSYTTDAFSRRESATIISLGSDNAAGGIDTAEDIQINIDANEAMPVSAVSCNAIVRYITSPATTFNANLTLHIAYKNGEGVDADQTFITPVTITGNVGNPQNNYIFGLSSALAQNLPIGIARVWADIDRNSSGNLLAPATAGPSAYITISDRLSSIHIDNLSVSVE
ncbi:MAG: prepilin-type N-terminal cleavage/methylation domain-containing protein [Thermodesulfovibrionia bacterium]|nr:prepilin-type N-terminal cleavage/methylation domain-containing protein [Thermodesulfovibrionia bacterium]